MKRFSHSGIAVLAFLALSISVRLNAAEEPSRPAPGTLLIVAGTGQAGFSGDGGPAVRAQLNGCAGVAFDTAGNLYVTELDNSRVRKVSPEGTISTVAGGGQNEPRPVDGIPAAEAQLADVSFLTLSGAGDLFVTGFFSNRLWKVSAEGWITTLQDQITGPTGVAVDAAGNLFIADHGRDRVQRITADGSISTMAGGGKKPPATADGGPANEAQLNDPFDVTVDVAGNLYIAQEFEHRVRRVSPDGIITTVAGNGKAGFSGDGGPATQARLNGPTGLAVDSAGNLFISDRDDYRVRKVTPDGVISTVAGTGKGQLSGIGGPASLAGLRGPTGLAVDAAGNLYIGDTAWWDNHTKRSKEPPSEHILMVVGVAAPGLIAGRPFPLR